MTPAEKEKLDQQARLQQMQINTRLVALEASHKLMSTPGFTDKTVKEGEPPANPGNGIDVITLIAQAQMIEGYVLGNIETETKAILDEINKPKPNIIKPVGSR